MVEDVGVVVVWLDVAGGHAGQPSSVDAELAGGVGDGLQVVDLDHRGEAGHADLDALTPDVADALVIGPESVGSIATTSGTIAKRLVDRIGVGGPEADPERGVVGEDLGDGVVLDGLQQGR